MEHPVITLQDNGSGYDVSISSSDGGLIYYTTDGTVPSAHTKKCDIYSGPFTVEYGTVIKAMAVKHGYYDSETAVSGENQSVTISFNAFM